MLNFIKKKELDLQLLSLFVFTFQITLRFNNFSGSPNINANPLTSGVR